MASSKLEKLMFLIGLKDEASKKATKLAANIQATVGKVQKHFKGLGIAGTAAYAAGKSLQALVGPAVEMNRALAEAGFEGAGAEGLKLLQQQAGKLAVTYGIAANDVITSSVGMQRAIKDLSDREVADLTGTANLLAKAGRMSVETTTGYMVTMYGIFQAQADRMGKSSWAAHMAAQTDFVSKTFKARGDEITAGFSTLGNKAQKAGISAGEQMTVLAALQKTMSGADAGTKYASFLDNAARAQKALGISMRDSQGKMLPMAGILDTIKVKFGDTLTEAQQKQFSKAFGDKDAGAFVNTLLSQSGKIGQAVKDVSQITNMNGVRSSARANTDAYQRWSATVGYLRANFMQKLMPSIDKFTNKATDKLEVINKWIAKYPNVARVIGYVVLAVTSLTGIVAVATAGFHLYKIASIALSAQSKGLLTVVKLLGTGFLKLGAIVLANPIVLCVLLIAAAIGIAIYFWNDFKAAFADTSWGAPFLTIMNALEERWNMFTDLMSDFTWTKLLKLVIASALLPLEVFVNGIGSLLDKLGFEAGKSLKDWKAADFAESMVGPEQAAQPAKGVLAAPAATGTPQAVPKNGEIAMRRAADPPGLKASGVAEPNIPVSAVPAMPSLAALKMPQPPDMPKGGIAAAAGKAGGVNGGKTLNVKEQHIHFENPPENKEDFMVMAMS